MYLVYKTFQGRNLSKIFGGILENWWFYKYILIISELYSVLFFSKNYFRHQKSLVFVLFSFFWNLKFLGNFEICNIILSLTLFCNFNCPGFRLFAHSPNAQKYLCWAKSLNPEQLKLQNSVKDKVLILLLKNYLKIPPNHEVQPFRTQCYHVDELRTSQCFVYGFYLWTNQKWKKKYSQFIDSVDVLPCALPCATQLF
jgi:hypothetical protein